ncbi:MAG: hypothetical protein ACLFTI_06505 [Anaerolineales bacterium]
MKKAFQAIANAAVRYYDELFYLVLMGGATFLSCLLILPGPFALAGLWYAAHRAVRRERVCWRDYRDGVKRYGVQAWGVVLIVLVGYVLIFSNIWFYNTPQVSIIDNESIVSVITSFLIAVIILWTCAAFYISSSLIEQKTGGLLLAVRNSIYLTFLHPIPTLIWVIFSGLLLVVSILIPILWILTPAYISVLSFTGFRMLVLPMLEEQENEGHEGHEIDELKQSGEDA